MSADGARRANGVASPDSAGPSPDRSQVNGGVPLTANGTKTRYAPHRPPWNLQFHVTDKVIVSVWWKFPSARALITTSWAPPIVLALTAALRLSDRPCRRSHPCRRSLPC